MKLSEPGDKRVWKVTNRNTGWVRRFWSLGETCDINKTAKVWNSHGLHSEKNNKPPRKEGTAEGKEDGGNLSDLNCRKTGQMGELIQPEMQKKVRLGDSFIQSELQKTGRWGTHSIRTAERQGDLENLSANDNIKSNIYA